MYRRTGIPHSNIAYLIDIKCNFRYNRQCEFCLKAECGFGRNYIYVQKVGSSNVVCGFI